MLGRWRFFLRLVRPVVPRDRSSRLYRAADRLDTWLWVQKTMLEYRLTELIREGIGD